MPVHSGTKGNYLCEICGTSYSRAEFLRRHARSAHQKEAGKTFHCTHCNKSFARSDVLSRHRRRCHPDEDGTPGSSGNSRGRTSSSDASASAASSPSDTELIHKLPPKPTTSYQHGAAFPNMSEYSAQPSDQFSIFDTVGSLLGTDTTNSNTTSMPGEYDYLLGSSDFTFNYNADPFLGAQPASTNALNLNTNPSAYNTTTNPLTPQAPMNFDVLGPEKTLRRIEFDEVSKGVGTPFNPSHNEISDRFYIPAERFAGPYSIAHWALPPLKQLSLLCANALQTTNVHLPLIHIPTFKLSETSVCVAFALCSTGGNTPKALSQHQPHFQTFQQQNHPYGVGDGSGSRIASLTDAERNSKPGVSAAEESGIIREVVRHEKLAMIHGSLSNKTSNTSQSDLIGLIMSLIVYYAPVILEEDAASSIWDGINGGFGFICEAMRSSGLLHPSASWMSTEKPKLTYFGERSKASVYMAWKNWVNDEQKRRAIFIIYLTDLLSAILTGKKPALRVEELEFVPMPANDKLWTAPTAQAWAKVVDSSPRTPTHGEMMQCIFKQVDDYHFNQDLGPFARNVMISSLLRGLLEIGDDDGGSVGRKYMQGLDQSSTVFAFRNALIAWRRGYDFDILCQKQATYQDQVSQQKQSAIYSNSSDSQAYSDSSTSHTSTTSGSPPTSSEPSPTKEYLSGDSARTEKENRPPFVSEPLPFFWMSQLLLNVLSPETSLFFNFVTPPQQNTYNVPRAGRQGLHDKMKNMDLKGMLIASRTFARMQEGVNAGMSTGMNNGGTTQVY
ncbi:hypothetical protein E3P99_00351 [Wallemia hederae]|uniref:C2H2-type domain-containing protein n=1 Tax=Wallemia hederae TaxID=1540922 RepID=A0A4T0FYK3_9BASI|nr:hypothetical protein E3P99_00351 [Wallemia hederae]